MPFAFFPPLLQQRKHCLHTAALSSVPDPFGTRGFEFGGARRSTYRGALISPGLSGLRHSVVSAERQRGITLPGSGVSAVVSCTPVRNTKCIN